MNQKAFVSLATLIFILIAILHALRIVYGWEAMIGGVAMPLWVSWVAVVIAGLLAYYGLQLSKKR